MLTIISIFLFLIKYSKTLHSDLDIKHLKTLKNMENETKVKMYTVISRNENETSMKMVQLTLCQFGKHFSTEVINVLSQRRNILFPVDGKVRKVNIVAMTIKSTKCLVVELNEKEFTKSFGGGKYKISIIKMKSSMLKIIDEITETVKPTEKVVVKQHTLTIPKPKSTSQGKNTVLITKNKTTRTKVISFPNHNIFSYGYSMIIRLNRQIPSTYSYLSNVG